MADDCYLVSMKIEVPYSDGTTKPHVGFRLVRAKDKDGAEKEARKLYAGYADVVYVSDPVPYDEAIKCYGRDYIRMHNLNF